MVHTYIYTIYKKTFKILLNQQSATPKYHKKCPMLDSQFSYFHNWLRLKSKSPDHTLKGKVFFYKIKTAKPYLLII